MVSKRDNDSQLATCNIMNGVWGRGGGGGAKLAGFFCLI
jgi:hypothetical protein